MRPWAGAAPPQRIGQLLQAQAASLRSRATSAAPQCPPAPYILSVPFLPLRGEGQKTPSPRCFLTPPPGTRFRPVCGWSGFTNQITGVPHSLTRYQNGVFPTLFSYVHRKQTCFQEGQASEGKETADHPWVSACLVAFSRETHWSRQSVL